MKGKVGRPSRYSEEVIDELCERLSKGEPMAAICRDEHMPGVHTVYDWANATEAVSARIARAREAGEDAIAAQVLEIVDTEPARVLTMHGDQIDSGDVANRKMRAEYRLKLLAKWNPKRWGERVDITSKDEKIDGGTIHITREIIGGK